MDLNVNMGMGGRGEHLLCPQEAMYLPALPRQGHLSLHFLWPWKEVDAGKPCCLQSSFYEVQGSGGSRSWFETQQRTRCTSSSNKDQPYAFISSFLSHLMSPGGHSLRFSAWPFLLATSEMLLTNSKAQFSLWWWHIAFPRFFTVRLQMLIRNVGGYDYPHLLFLCVWNNLIAFYCNQIFGFLKIYFYFKANLEREREDFHPLGDLVCFFSSSLYVSDNYVLCIYYCKIWVW